MHEGNPFHAKTLKIVESCPVARAIRRDTRAISIVPDREDWRAKARLDEIEAILERIPAPERIELFAIDYNSNLTKLPRLDRFPNLRHAHVAGRKLKSLAGLETLSRIEDLFVVSFQERDLSRFAALSLDRFRMIRGNVARAALRARYAFLQGCTKLTAFDGAKIEHLTVEACNRLDLETLARVEGMVRLDLIAQRKIPTLGWLVGCKKLRVLVIGGNSLHDSDVAGLLASRRLATAFIGSGSRKLIEELGRRNPRVLVTNGTVAFHGGRSVDVREHHRIAEEVLPQRPR